MDGMTVTGCEDMMPVRTGWFSAVMTASLLLAAPGVSAADVTVDLVTKREKLEVNPGRRDTVVTLNGGVPGPVLRFREGDTVTVNLKNELPEMTAIHWHGLLIPGHHDGAPGFNGFQGVATGRPTPISSRCASRAPIGTTATPPPRSRRGNMAPSSSIRRTGSRSRSTASM
jgi:hypothetical protein